jgi:hypothetical protein
MLFYDQNVRWSARLIANEMLRRHRSTEYVALCGGRQAYITLHTEDLKVIG